MKKIIFPLILIMLLSGCTANGSKQPVIQTSFAYNCDVEFDESKYNCLITRNDNSEFTLKVMSPQEMQGMEITCVGEEITVKYKELEYLLDPNEMGDYSFFSTLISVFNSLTRTNELVVRKGNNGFEYSGKCKQGKFTLYQNDDSTYNRLQINNNLKITFKNKV